jgi:(2R)-3-sulfolactate dehydrogenase (NADP+)
MSDMIAMTLDEAEAFVIAALTASGASEINARAQAVGVIGAELDGIKSHSFPYVPIYCEHLLCGKVKGYAEPQLKRLSDAAFMVDAANGFAHPAINTGLEVAIPAARTHAIAAFGIRNSYNCGVLGFHTDRIARAGLLGIGFTNAPASIAPVGGRRAVIGTNPFSMAVPDGEGGVALLIDQSASVVAKSELALRASKGESIPEGWAFGPDGEPTTDPQVGLKGTMAPSGGYKGFGVGLLVELMAAALTGAILGIHASSFATNEGGPPATGQFFLLLDPQAFSGGEFGERMEALVLAIEEQKGTHLPGRRRAQARARVMRDGVEIPAALHQRIQGYIGGKAV